MSRKDKLDFTGLDEHQAAVQADRDDQIIKNLLPGDDLSQVVAKIELDHLLPDPYQPRKSFKPEKINELARSMADHGLQDPLVVRPAQGPKNRGKYWVVSGERRLRAAKQLGWSEVDCRIKNLDPTKAAVLALAMNVHREDLSEIEKAESLQRLKTMTQYTWEEVAKLVQISPVYARQLGSLLNASEPVKDMVRKGELSTRKAIALKALPEAQQEAWAKKAVSEGLTAEEIREQTQHIVRPRAIRTIQEVQVPTSIGKAAVAPAITEEESVSKARVGTKTKLLEDSLLAVQNIRKAITRETWSPSDVTERQQVVIHELYKELSQLHQEVVYIRAPFKEDPQEDARRLRDAKMPF